jgi:hypothetical protein
MRILGGLDGALMIVDLEKRLTTLTVSDDFDVVDAVADNSALSANSRMSFEPDPDAVERM